MTRLHFLQHVAFEGPSGIARWAVAHDALVTTTLLYRDETLPDTSAFDWLVVMGGPMGANDESIYPWMDLEKRLIESAIHDGKRVLGVCLGAQLIASVLGARVYPNREREVGWFEVGLTPAGKRSGLFNNVSEGFYPLHWHGDTFELPAGAVNLAESEGCLHQSFRFGERVLGLQFHLEIGEDEAKTMLECCPGDLAPGRYIMSPSEILGQKSRFEAANSILRSLLDSFAAC